MCDGSFLGRPDFTATVVHQALRAASPPHDAYRADRVARHCVLDWFAVSLAALDEPLVAILTRDAVSQGGRCQASLVGCAERVPARQAALVNGALSHALDYDDVNLAMLGHPTVAILPAVLATGEAAGSTGREVLAAFRVGYEAACHVGAAVNPSHYGRGFHATATVGCFGAALGCAHLLGLTLDQAAHAVGIAATRASGLKSMFGTMCKPLHAGMAAETGVLASEWAALGFESRTDALECPQGFADTQADLLALEGEAETRFHILQNLFKFHASCYQTHAAIEAARRLRAENRLEPDDIRRVVIRHDAGAASVCNIPAPRTGLEAKFSLRATVAFALAGIETDRLDTFSDDNVQRPELVALRERIEVELVPGRKVTSSDVLIETIDGRELVASMDVGLPAHDLDEQERRLSRKFEALVHPKLGPTASARLADMILHIDDLPELSAIFTAAARSSLSPVN